MKSHGMIKRQKQAGRHSFTRARMCCGICVLPQQKSLLALRRWYNHLQTTLVQKHIKPWGQLHLPPVAINNCRDRNVQKVQKVLYAFFIHNPCRLPASLIIGQPWPLSVCMSGLCYHGNRGGWQKVEDTSLAIWAICMPLLFAHTWLVLPGKRWERWPPYRNDAMCSQSCSPPFQLGWRFQTAFFPVYEKAFALKKKSWMPSMSLVHNSGCCCTKTCWLETGRLSKYMRYKDKVQVIGIQYTTVLYIILDWKMNRCTDTDMNRMCTILYLGIW